MMNLLKIDLPEFNDLMEIVNSGTETTKQAVTLANSWTNDETTVFAKVDEFLTLANAVTEIIETTDATNESLTAARALKFICNENIELVDGAKILIKVLEYCNDYIDEVKKVKLWDLFSKMGDDELVGVWGDYCCVSNNYDDYIYYMDEIDDIFSGCSPTEILNRFYFGSDDYSASGSANPNRKFFRYDGYANIVSFDYIYNGYTKTFNHIDIDSLIDYIVTENCDFENDDIFEILDED